MKTLFSLIFYISPFFVSAQVSKQEIDSSINQIENYWKMKFSQKEITFNSPSIYYYNYQNPIQTPCGTSNQLNAFYCGASHSIAISKDLVDTILINYNKSVLVFTIAHEYGHAVQKELGKSSILSIDRELQADCLAGTFYNKTKEFLDINTLGKFLSDYSEQNQGFKTLTDPQAHGDANARMKAFKTGFEVGSVNRCLKDYDIEGQSLNLLESIFDIFKKKENKL